MSASSGLLLPGERSRASFGFSRALVAGIAGFAWLPVQASVLPLLGLHALPFDPLLPLVAAFALGGQRLEAWSLALVLGYLADSYSGLPSGRLLLQYAVVACLAAPLHGRIVLRDRVVPALGITILALLSGLAVLVFLGALGASVPLDFRQLPVECFGTGCAAVLFWPFYRRVAGWQDERSVGLGGRP